MILSCSGVILQVSSLFPRDEMDEILQELAPAMKKEFPRLPPTNENLYSYYMTRVKWNLHVALCFSPVIIAVYRPAVIAAHLQAEDLL